MNLVVLYTYCKGYILGFIRQESVSCHGGDDLAFHGHSWSTNNTQKLFVSMFYPKPVRKLNKFHAFSTEETEAPRKHDLPAVLQ